MVYQSGLTYHNTNITDSNGIFPIIMLKQKRREPKTGFTATVFNLLRWSVVPVALHSTQPFLCSVVLCSFCSLAIRSHPIDWRFNGLVIISVSFRAVCMCLLRISSTLAFSACSAHTYLFRKCVKMCSLIPIDAVLRQAVSISPLPHRTLTHMQHHMAAMNERIGNGWE